MTKLDEFLLIPDKLERVEALVNYARALNIDIIQAQNNQGGYTEEKLALLIFDAENDIKHERTDTYQLLSATIFFWNCYFGTHDDFSQSSCFRL